ncbi:alcohol dehydrogenase [Nocardioides sp. Root1257]|uniref:aldo/keto reductase n=1 Tax=unclassified Nocardioides TaxID=2615069 RepID=UPI0007010E67|nr:MULTISPECIES: aldo/keto reductase [unclassified Nocardioides]KQW42658.1 alcohol dehydrogenase [Nocardioides sp. Root1257]KRC39916.1 alcohol dehydrogenase [Nocardioides sp. Root224]
MEYARLGSSGLQVSRVCLGGMTYGDIDRGNHEWTLPYDQAEQFIRQALDLGINYFDTANFYSLGSSEEIFGKALLSMSRREDVIIATKVAMPMGSGPNDAGLSRGAILTQVDASLKRLGTDYIDQYIVHRADPLTPWEETMQALDDLVRAGKVRYLGASSMYAWQLAKSLAVSDRHDLASFASMQNHYNLLYREEEREMIPLCLDAGLGLTPWSPLARGRLARGPEDVTNRARLDQTDRDEYFDGPSQGILVAVEKIAEERGVPRAQVALAWLLGRTGVTSAVVGATKSHHLEHAVAALDIRLEDSEISRLDAGYAPRPINGH